jgi:hypothetical protein
MRSVLLDFLLPSHGNSLREERRQEAIGPFADMVANFLKFSRDPEMSEGPDPGLGVQIDTVEKRTINVEKHCFDHGWADFEELRVSGVARRAR